MAHRNVLESLRMYTGFVARIWSGVQKMTWRVTGAQLSLDVVSKKTSVSAILAWARHRWIGCQPCREKLTKRQGKAPSGE